LVFPFLRCLRCLFAANSAALRMRAISEMGASM
jgi:hypothetical protein